MRGCAGRSECARGGSSAAAVRFRLLQKQREHGRGSAARARARAESGGDVQPVPPAAPRRLAAPVRAPHRPPGAPPCTAPATHTQTGGVLSSVATPCGDTPTPPPKQAPRNATQPTSQSDPREAALCGEGLPRDARGRASCGVPKHASVMMSSSAPGRGGKFFRACALGATALPVGHRALIHVTSRGSSPLKKCAGLSRPRRRESAGGTVRAHKEGDKNRRAPLHVPDALRPAGRHAQS